MCAAVTHLWRHNFLKPSFKLALSDQFQGYINSWRYSTFVLNLSNFQKRNNAFARNVFIYIGFKAGISIHSINVSARETCQFKISDTCKQYLSHMSTYHNLDREKTFLSGRIVETIRFISVSRFQPERLCLARWMSGVGSPRSSKFRISVKNNLICSGRAS